MENSNNKENDALVTISIVSHGQLKMIHDLLGDLQKLRDSDIEVILTLNNDEELLFDTGSYPFAVTVVKNNRPKGFSENHNSAFAVSKGKYFCVLNPDVRILYNPFPTLLEKFKNKKIGLVAPKVVNAEGEVEDSMRPFPNPFSILAKALPFNRHHTKVTELIDKPYWVAGMIMLFNSKVFKSIGGFDERYFLYYEDVDICARLRLSGCKIVYCPEVSVVHAAQRTSHRNLQYFRWHLTSMVRYFTSKVFFRTLFSN
jgi:N-acetylglucosaminyl-diphospho-decaprenol L-rhamnosyltransferase